MADSPKCPACLEIGIMAQTYRVAGKGAFKCHECNKAFSIDQFKPIDFTWKTAPEDYNRHLTGRGSKLKV